MMKTVDKFIVEGIVFCVLLTVYLVWSDKPIFFKNFWRTYFYVLLYALPLSMFVTVLPIIQNTFSLMLVLSIIIFLSEFIIFNVLMINATEKTWFEYCTSLTFGYVFTGSILLMLIATFVVKLFI